MSTSSRGTSVTQKRFGKFTEPLIEMPDLVEQQLASFDVLMREGITKVISEYNPIEDYAGKKFGLEFSKVALGDVQHDEHTCKKRMLTYQAPLKAVVTLSNKTTGEKKSQEMFIAEFPMMTPHGSFIINGIERVVVPQLARSYGVFFLDVESKGKTYFAAKIIPSRGVWLEIESEADNVVGVKIDRKKKIFATTFLRALGAKTDSEILALFKGAGDATKKAVALMLSKDPMKTHDDACSMIYRTMRDGDLATPENAREFVKNLFSKERYDISKVGRYQFNTRFELPQEKAYTQVITLEDAARIVDHIITLNVTPGSQPDDIDHLGFRRVRYVGEMLEQQMRVGMSRLKRNIQDRMSTVDTEVTSPLLIVNPRPFATSVKEFFTGNSLAQFMDQQNVLAELEHLRTLSALGPGGLTRERAGFEVRDVHTSHYGRLCPIHTPEGQNIGLILRLASYARINEFGVIETPYAKVKGGKVTDEVVYMNALDEENKKIAHAAVPRTEGGKIQAEMVEARFKGEPVSIPVDEVEYIEVATNQAFSVATSLIPFIEHDDTNRTLMGSNMQKQATPCVIPELPRVATGIESRAARDSGRMCVAEEAGEIVYVDATLIKVKNKDGKTKEYPLITFERTNEFSVIHQRPIISLGDTVKKGQVLADASTTDRGQVALGQNVRVAFMSWSGNNYEDAIILSERLVKKSVFTTIHMEEFECVIRDTKLGPESTTHDIPNVSETRLRNLDEEGIIRIGAEVRPGDILVGKVTPKGETQLTAEERLLRAIFGDKAKDVKDTSLRVPAGKRGRVVGVQIFSRERGDQLESGVIKKVHVEVAQVRNVTVGDKLAGRHGNKGVISRVLPEEDMPYDKDGNPIDVILTPLGVPSRMNLGQILEMHLGLAAEALGYQAVVPPFAGATEEEIVKELVAAGYDKSGKMMLHDGRTGDAFKQPIAVGVMYMLKLHHMVEDKIHMRSIGPYSLTTQQPLGGKAQNGGQRVGEMEVWAFLGYGAAHALHEILTYKSDDIVGRSQAFDSIVKGEPIREGGMPATFNVLVRHLRGLGLDVALTDTDEFERDER